MGSKKQDYWKKRSTDKLISIKKQLDLDLPEIISKLKHADLDTTKVEKVIGEINNSFVHLEGEIALSKESK